MQGSVSATARPAAAPVTRARPGSGRPGGATPATGWPSSGWSSSPSSCWRRSSRRGSLPFDPNYQYEGLRRAAPGVEGHLLGTDEVGPRHPQPAHLRRTALPLRQRHADGDRRPDRPRPGAGRRLRRRQERPGHHARTRRLLRLSRRPARHPDRRRPWSGAAQPDHRHRLHPRSLYGARRAHAGGVAAQPGLRRGGARHRRRRRARSSGTSSCRTSSVPSSSTPRSSSAS